MRPSARELASDVVVLAGFAVVVFGVWQVYEPAAFVLAGVFLCVIGYGLARARVPNRGG